MDAIRRRRIDNYRTRSETYESLKKYISMNFDGLKDDAIEQIKAKKYSGKLLEYNGDVITTDISYDKKTKQHLCKIEIVSMYS